MTRLALSPSALPIRLVSFRLLLPLSVLVEQSRYSAAQEGAVAAAMSKSWIPIPLDGFSDGMHHAVMRAPGGKAPYRRNPADQIVQIGENLLARRTKWAPGKNVPAGPAGP